MIKKLFITSFIMLAAFGLQAQSDLYSKLSAFISNQTKESSNDRLIAINVWSVNDNNSRKLNAEFEEVYKTFEYAKLKGGGHGIIVMDINFENDNVNADITLQKDGIKKLIKVSADNTEIVNHLKGKSAGYNIVFDCKGNLLYENLAPGTVFNSIQKLITR